MKKQNVKVVATAFALIVGVVASIWITACASTKQTSKTVTPVNVTNNGVVTTNWVTNTVTTTVVNTNLANFENALLATNGIVVGIADGVAQAEVTSLVQKAIAKDPSSKQWFVDANNALTLLLNGGNVTSTQLEKSLSQIPIATNSPAYPIIVNGEASLLAAYKTAEASSVSQAVSNVPYLGQLLTSVNNALTAALQ